MIVENNHVWEVVLRGLARFFDEGVTVWSKKKFVSLFLNEEAAISEYVTFRLVELEQRGVIVFPGEDDVYIKVLSV